MKVKTNVKAGDDPTIPDPNAPLGFKAGKDL
jgi:hypothetical protein